MTKSEASDDAGSYSIPVTKMRSIPARNGRFFCQGNRLGMLFASFLYKPGSFVSRIREIEAKAVLRRFVQLIPMRLLGGVPRRGVCRLTGENSPDFKSLPEFSAPSEAKS